MDTSPSLKICGGCGTSLEETNRVRCSKCKSAYYCNAKCQRKAWQSHKTVCFDASLATPEMHENAREQTPVLIQKAFEAYLKTEIDLHASLCLVITDISNAQDNMQYMPPSAVRQGMWDAIPHQLRADFEMNCKAHEECTTSNANAHVVYLDSNALEFKTSLIPVSSFREVHNMPPPPAAAAAMDEDEDKTVATLMGDDFVEGVIETQIQALLQNGSDVGQGNQFAIQYLTLVNEQAESMFTEAENARVRARMYSRKRLREIVGEIGGIQDSK